MQNPFIENVSMANIIKGFHYDPGENSVLIQITDPGTLYPRPKLQFKKRYNFYFLDVDEVEKDLALKDWGPTQTHAKDLFAILKQALTDRANVIVHCHAGLCRSGAVAEIGIIMGFRDTDVLRIPNSLLKKRMFEEYLKDVNEKQISL